MLHDTPQQNGAVEWVHGTVFNAVHANLVAAQLPKNLWAECLNYVAYIYNRVPHVALEFETPFHALFGKDSDLGDAQPFGQFCVVRLESAPKLGSRGEICRWLSPDRDSLGQRIYWPKSGKVTVERNLQFIDKSAIPIEEQKQLSTDDAIDIGPRETDGYLEEPDENIVPT
jgi:hypothetical protein